MTQHHFLLSKGIWLGMGKMEFSISPDTVIIYMKWNFTPMEDRLIIVEQQIGHQGRDDLLLNQYRFVLTSDTTFDIELKHEGQIIKGNGHINGSQIFWEFVDDKNFIGFETYTLQDNGEYSLHAEYISGEELRTVVNGRVWCK